MAFKKRYLLLALGSGLLLAFLVYSFLQQLEARVNQAQEGVPVVVSCRDLPLRTVLTPEMLRVVWVPRRLVLAGSFRKVADVVGKVVRVPLAAGEPLTRAKVTEGGGGDLALRIPPGKRAFTLNVDAANRLNGQIAPGDRVDVLLVKGGTGTNTAETLLQDLLVLAASEQTLTLAVTPWEGQRLGLAEEEGQIRISLRGPQERGKYQLPRSVTRSAPAASATPPGTLFPTLSAVSAGPPQRTQRKRPAAVSPPSAPVAPKKEDGFAVRIIRGTEAERVIFQTP